MLLKCSGIETPQHLIVNQVEQLKDDGSNELNAVRKDLLPLRVCGWPFEIVDKLVEIFKAIGVENPDRQKLVQPYALYFGGRDIDGAADLSKVDWGMVIDYFTWEAACWNAQYDEPGMLRVIKQMRKKWGCGFSHQRAYEDGKGF